MKHTLCLLLLACGFTITLKAQFFFDGSIGTPLQVGQIKGAEDVAFDATGNIYVASGFSHCIMKFDPNGNPVSQIGIGGNGVGEFNNPVSIAIDAAGNIYVADEYRSQVFKFDNLGVFKGYLATYGSGLGQVNGPVGITIDANGNIFVVDSQNHRIQKFNSTGTYTSQWGSRGIGDIQFEYPGGIAVDASGNIYVADTGNQRIMKFKNDGSPITKWGSIGPADGQFYSPRGIAVDAGGSVYVSELYGNRVQKFNILGQFEGKFGSWGEGNNQFYFPKGLEIDAAGNIYVADRANDRVQKFNSAYVYLASIGTPLGDGQIDHSFGVTTDATGNIYVADGYNHQIQKFSSTGSFVTRWGGFGSSGNGKFNVPYDIAVDSNGDVYVVDGADRVQRFSNAGVFKSQWGSSGSGDTQFNQPRSIAVDGNNMVYVADMNNHRVLKFNNSGAFITKWGTLGIGVSNLNYPEALTLDAAGNVYVADTQNSRIQKFSNTGTPIFRWGSNGSEDGNLLGPVGISISPTGDIYVSSDNRFQKFSNNGDFEASYFAYGFSGDQYLGIRGIDAGTQGNLLVTDVNNGRILKFSVLDIISLSTTNGLAGSSLIITGSGYSTTLSQNIVKINGTTCTITTGNATSLTVTVPTGATTGYVTVTRGGSTVTVPTEFLVLPLAITSFTPGVGIAGSAVTISGTGFSSTAANNIVKFNGIAATVTASTATSVTATLPAGNTVGKITVTVNGITATSINNFDGILALNSFTPANALTGASVTITGTGFSSTLSNQTVKFNGTTAVITAASSTSLTVTVPNGATTGKISVLRDGVTVLSTSEFLMLPLTITSFSPAVAAIGTIINLNGTGFSSVASNNIVSFNGIAANPTNSTSTSITTTVPATATTGKISVTVSGVSTTSATDFIVTPLAVTFSSFPEYFVVESESAISTLQVNDVKEIQSLKINSHGISEDITKLKINPISFSSSANSIEVIVPASYFTDPLGLHYWFSAFDKFGNEIQSAKGYTYLKYPATSGKQVIPDLKNGKSAAAYQLISVPLVLSKNTIKEVFKDLGAYNNKNWRLFFLNGNQTIQESPSDIKPGVGYWFIMRDQIEINPGEGVVVKATQDTPYKMSLKQGWNLIGNPYNFTISWNDVITRNGLSEQKIKFRQFINGGFVNEPLLKPYRGGFVDSDIAREIEIPVINKNTTGGRISSKQFHAIDQPQWEVSLTLQEGEFANSLFGFGMNPNASLEKDVWDETALPMLEGLSSFELAFKKQQRDLIKDIVPYKENYTWTADLSTNNEIIIHWDNSYFGDNEKQLVLELSDRVELIDMRDVTQTTLSSGQHTVKFHYGTSAYIHEQVMEKTIRVGHVYPNPMSRKESVLSIPISLPEGENEVELSLQNIVGGKIELSASGKYNGGRQLLQWAADFNQLSAGLFLLRIKTYNPVIGVTTKFAKVILK